MKRATTEAKQVLMPDSPCAPAAAAGIYGLISVPYLATYCAAKFAVTGLVYSLRRELKARQQWCSFPAPHFKTLA